MTKAPPAGISVAEYIRSFPRGVQTLLRTFRATVKAAAPKADEAVKYGIPTLVIDGKSLVHFGGFKAHIGFFPGPAAIAAFKNELADYPQSKGTVRFPFGVPLPLSLIKKIVAYRVKEHAAVMKAKKSLG